MDIEKQRRNAKYRLELMNKATRQEVVFKEFLDEQKIPYLFQKGFLEPYHRIVDFYIKKYRLIVEIDGGYHKTVAGKDRMKDQTWSRFNTLRIQNEDVDSGAFRDMFLRYIGEKSPSKKGILATQKR